MNRIIGRKRIGIFLSIILMLTIMTGCKGKKEDVVAQTGEVEKIIETVSLGKPVSDKVIDKISFSETFRKKFLSTVLLEPNNNQIVRIIGSETEKEDLISIEKFLNQDEESRKKLYDSFLEKQKRTLGAVTRGEKSFSKTYEKDGLAYVFVKIPFAFDKLVIMDEEYKVHGYTLYRSYLWQKVDEKWQLNDYRQMVDFDVAKMENFFSAEIEEGMKKDRDKFFTVFGEKVQFEE